MYNTPSGAVKLQVLVTPHVAKQIARYAKRAKASRSYVVAVLLNQALQDPWLQFPTNGKYQPRGFAKQKAT